MAQYLDEFELSSLNGTNGFKINGVDASDLAGHSVASAGDVNGDGFADIIIGAYAASLNGSSYVVFGKASGFADPFELSSIDGTNGFEMVGEASAGVAGWSVASAGDVNNDGYDDVIVGAYRADHGSTDTGSSYVVFGKAAGFDTEIDLGNLDGTDGFRIDGETSGDKSGLPVASAGDVNGDGYSDLIVGAQGADPHGTSSGAAYVLFAKASGFSSIVGLSSLDGNNGFQINGEAAGDEAGSFIASAGDINGDDLADLIIAAPGDDTTATDSGASYVVFGMETGFGATLDLSSLDGDNGFKINGEATTDFSGHSVASGGDVNADGFADLIIGAPNANPNGDEDAGSSYVVFGTDEGFDAELDLSTLDGSNGFRIDGEDEQELSGWSVASAGDFNGDGFADVIVGAEHASPTGTNSGASYVVFGKASGFGATLELSSLDGNNGFRVDGEAAGDISGYSVAGAGDVNGDGFADLIVGAKFAGPNGTHSGASYVIFGGKPGEAVTRSGTEIGNTIHGSEFNDTLNGHDGDDTLIGYGGVDTISGGGEKDAIEGDGGADVLSGGNHKDSIEGGSQDDTITGGAADDALDGGAGNDTFIYGGASDSTSSNYDNVKGFDFSSGDLFDLTISVTGKDATVATGALSKATFDTNLATAVGSGQLAAHHAVLFTPNSGDLSGKTFLIVDINNSAGYQASADLVIQLSNSVDIGSLGTNDFI